MKFNYIFILLIALILFTCSKSDSDEHLEANSYTNIPDQNFESRLIELGIDLDGKINQRVLTSDIVNVSVLVLDSNGISDLTGIENFVNLKILDARNNGLTCLNLRQNIMLEELCCSDNGLTSIDISNNTKLKTIGFNGNKLTSIDISNSPELNGLWLNENNLTTFDVSNNSALCILQFSHNHLTSLDVSNNLGLVVLQCSNNDLTGLDISNSPHLFHLNCTNNPLTCIKVNLYQLNNYFSYNWLLDSNDIVSTKCD